MAKQKGILLLKGTIGGISFYKTQDGFLAREKGGVDGERIKKDPAFIRTRENNAEFGSAAESGKLIRDSLRKFLQKASDNRVNARLMGLMSKIKNMDTSSIRGERKVAIGIAAPEAHALLKKFNFNNRALMGSILFHEKSVDTSTGVISMIEFIPMEDLKWPEGATHLSLSGAWARMNFEEGNAEVKGTNKVNMAIDANSSDVVLTPIGVPVGTGGLNLFILLIEFFQEVNGKQYSLKDGAYNAMSILEVS